jgi:WD40 repeat protein
MLTEITSVSFSPDGRQFLAGTGFDASIRIWDAESAKEICTFGGQTEWGVIGATFTPDGRHIVAANADGNVRSWDLRTGEQLIRSGHASWVSCVAFSPDGKRLLSGSRDATIRLWEVDTAKEIHSFKVADGPYTGQFAVTLSSDGSQALVGGKKGGESVLSLWDAERWQELASFRKTDEDYQDFILSVAFSASGRLVLAGGTGQIARLIDKQSGHEIRLKGHTGAITAVGFAPDGTFAITASADQTVRLWDTQTGNALSVHQCSHGGVSDLAISPGGHSVFASEGNVVQVLELDHQKLSRSRLLLGHGRAVNSLALTRDGTTLASADEDGRIIIWSVDSGDKVLEFQFPGAVRHLAFSPDGQCLATANYNGTIYILRWRKGA